MADKTKPIPLPDLDSAPYWAAARQHKFMLPKCQKCETFLFPPRSPCPRCLTGDLQWTELSGRGTVYTYCIMHDNFIPGFQSPYVIAQVQLEEQVGLRLNANILGCPPSAVTIGMPVEVTFEDLTAEISLPQFRPRRS